VAKTAILILLLTAARTVTVAAPLSGEDVAQLHRLDLLFDTHGPLPSVAEPDRALLYRQFVRDRMTQDSFYAAVLPRLFATLSRDLLAGLPLIHFRLKKATVAGKEVYYRSPLAPCNPRDAVAVQPWWDLDSTVLVCDSAYHPDVKRDTRAVEQYCETNGYFDLDGVLCGCGEHLVNCSRDAGQAKQLDADTKAEPLWTLQYVIQNHKPFTSVLTMNESVRTELGDFFYARNRFFRGHPLELPPVHDHSKPTLKPRDSEFDGGLLTTPLFLFWEFSRRVIVSYLWEDFLCTPLQSSAVHASQMFELKDAKLHTHDYIALAGMIGCKDCHARIENAVRALRGFTPTTDGYRFLSERVYAGPISFFVRDANDVRAEGPASPLWLGQTMSLQPEFDACIVNKVGELVYNGYPVPEMVSRSLRARFAESHDFATLFEDAIVARFAAPPDIAHAH
jgi:hypothetical protein